MVERPDAKPCLPVDPVPADGSEEARVLGAVAVVAHDEILVGAEQPSGGAVVGPVRVVDPLLRQVWLRGAVPRDVEGPRGGPGPFAPQTEDVFVEGGRV